MMEVTLTEKTATTSLASQVETGSRGKGFGHGHFM